MTISRRRFLGLSAGAAALGTGGLVNPDGPETSGGLWHRASQLIRSGALGGIRHCQVRVSVPGTPGAAAWCQATERRLGPAAGSLCAPLAGLLLATRSGFPTRVSAAGGAWSGDKEGALDAMVATAEFPEGHTFVLTASPVRRRGLQAIIRGDKAALTIENESLRFIRESGGVTQASAPPSEAPGPLDTYPARWLRAICDCDAEQGYRAMAILAAAVEACRSRTTQHFEARM